jgi:hypothetical protein
MYKLNIVYTLKSARTNKQVNYASISFEAGQKILMAFFYNADIKEILSINFIRNSMPVLNAETASEV